MHFLNFIQHGANSSLDPPFFEDGPDVTKEHIVRVESDYEIRMPLADVKATFLPQKAEFLATLAQFRSDAREEALEVLSNPSTDFGLSSAVSDYNEFGSYSAWERIESAWSEESEMGCWLEELKEKYNITDEEIRKY